MATTKRIKSPIKTQASVAKEIDYILNPEKTQDETCCYVDSQHCSVVGTAEQFQSVRQRWGKDSGNLAYHFVQSFAPGETTPAEAHACGVELATALFGNDNYQVVFATHLDREHLHNHFVVNAVNLLNGKKLQTDHEFIKRMQRENDRICRAHNLSVIEHRRSGEGKTYAEWIIDKNDGFTWRGAIRKDIDELIPTVNSLKELLLRLEDNGYAVSRRGKYLRLSPPDTDTFFRFSKLGQGYTEEEITDRILNKKSFATESVRTHTNTTYRKTQRVNYRGHLPIRTHSGLRALYYVYLHRLQSIFSSTSDYHLRVPVQVRNDYRRANELSADIKLIFDYKIDNTLQLSELYYSFESQVSQLTSRWGELRLNIALTDNPEEIIAIREDIATTESEIRTLRNNMRSCQRIYDRSSQVKGSLRALRQTRKSVSTAAKSNNPNHNITNERNDDNVNRS